MDFKWEDERRRKFVTNVGLITSNGPNGHNIFACEWTHQISYSPGLISISIGNSRKASAENIKETKEFGVNLAAEDQNVIASIAGGSHGFEVDKIAVLKELGFTFSKARGINVLMVDGSAMQVECRLVKVIESGSHTLFIAEITDAYPLIDKEPLIYTGGKYFKKGEQLSKPNQEVLDRIESLTLKHKRQI